MRLNFDQKTFIINTITVPYIIMIKYDIYNMFTNRSHVLNLKDW